MDAATRELINRPSGKVTVIYASRLMKGWEAAQAIASFKAQETIRPMTERILTENGGKELCLR